MTWKLLT